MLFELSIEDFMVRLPRPLDEFEQARATALLEDAVNDIQDAVEDAGLDPLLWIADDRNRRRAVRVARAMVAQSIMVGEDIGKASWSTGTGPYNESASWSGEIASPDLWGEVDLTDAMLDYLGLFSRAVGGYSFPPAMPWPERGHDGFNHHQAPYWA